MKNTSRIPIVAVIAALVAALAFAGCGGGGGTDPNKLLDQTFNGSKKVRSGRLDLSLALTAQGAPQLQGPVTVKLGGPFQSQGNGALPKFDFQLALAAAGRSFNAGAVSTGDSGFLRFQGQAYAVPPNVFASFKQGFLQAQQQRNGKKSNTSLSSLGIDPRGWLKDAQNKGDVDVAGTKTEHVAAKVDVGKLLDDVNRILGQAGKLGLSQTRQLPTSISPQQRKQVEDAVKEASFDVYSGKDDHILRRMTVKLRFEVPSSARSQAGGLTGGTLSFDLTLAGLNQPQTVTAPGNARPFSELTAKLRSTLGGVGGGAATGGGTSSSSAGGAAGNPNAQRYLQCLQQAGGDVAKAQKCATLLNG